MNLCVVVRENGRGVRGTAHADNIICVEMRFILLSCGIKVPIYSLGSSRFRFFFFLPSMDGPPPHAWHALSFL
jgi:hypothetical protein